MESIEELKTHLTTWLDGRIDEAVKTAVAEANKDLTIYLDTRFGKLEFDINNVGGVVDSMAKDLGTVVDSVTKLANTVLAIPTQIAQEVSDTLGKLNPFHLP